MNLTVGQEAGLAMIKTLATFDGAPRVGILAGLAGTGKTTLVGRVPEAVGGYPIIVAPTGKAAVRVRELTGIRARTIHSWQYRAEEDGETGEVKYQRKPPDQVELGEVPLVAVDEGSMVGEDVWNDLLETARCCRMNVLIVGDPFQLPPVVRRSGRGGEPRPFDLLGGGCQSHARVDLTEVTRQALESPVLRAASLVREGRLSEALLQLPQVTPREARFAACAAHQAGGTTIVHANSTRLGLNLAVRRELGLPEGELRPGEPLLVLRNSYALNAFNGEVVRFEGWKEEPAGEHKIWCWIRKAEEKTRFGIAEVSDGGQAPPHLGGCPVTAGASVDCVAGSPCPGYEPEELSKGHRSAIVAVAEVFGNLAGVSAPAVAKMARILYGVSAPDPRGGPNLTVLPSPLLSANFGYVFTAHKAQGSEWPSALVAVEPTVRFGTPEGLRWIYTALTRCRLAVAVCVGTPATK